MINKVIKSEKNELRIELNNLTIAELLRKFLVDDSNVTFAAWRKDHPTKNPVLTIKTEGKAAKKSLADAIGKAEDLFSSIKDSFKKTAK
jgi:DNA-directed RNA polymerase subunit L